jgi:hypothetical protein
MRPDPMADENPAETPAEPAGGDPPDDEEFAKIPASPKRRSPIVAIAVIAVAGLLLWKLFDDTRFALGPKAPDELGDARGLGLATAPSDKLVDNRFVAVRGMPDRRNALLFEPKGDSYRRAFYRLLGTNTRLLVRADETSSRHSLDDRFVGRLRRFDAIPYADQIRGYYANDVRVTRLLDLAVLQRNLADKNVALLDRAGDPAKLAAGDSVGLEVDFSEDLKISLSKKQFAVEEDARHEAERLGVPVGPATTTGDGYIYVIRMDPAKRDELLKKLDEHGFPFAARRERFTAKAGDLTVGEAPDTIGFSASKDNPIEYVVDGNKLAPKPLGARTSLPLSRVASVQYAAPVAIPADAFILVENETPGGFTWVLAVDALLVVFLLFNIWMLVRVLRRPAPPPTPSPTNT